MTAAEMLEKHSSVLTTAPRAMDWLRMRVDLGLAPRTVDAYARGLSEYSRFSAASGADILTAGREHVARFVRHLTDRPSLRSGTERSVCGCSRLSNATIQQRLTALRLFYDYLVEEGLRNTNPVGRGRYARGVRRGGSHRGLIPRETRLPWVPGEDDWRAFLAAARRESIRNRVMLALAYDAGLRREELCSLRTDDLDPGRHLG